MVATKDTPLSTFGEKQAQRLGEVMLDRGLEPTAFFTSPYFRCYRTALILQRKLSPQRQDTVVEPFDDLHDIEGSEERTLEELEAIGYDVYAHPFNPTQETLENLISRQRQVFRKILEVSEKNRYKTVAIVSHGDPLAAIFWTLNHEGVPSSYAEMIKDYYPRKGEALGFDYVDGMILSKPIKIATELQGSKPEERG